MANEPVANEPGKAVSAILDTLIDTIKSSVPQRSDGKSLFSGIVYSQLVLGQLVDPDDYKDPWSPMKGTVQSALPAAAPAAGAPAAGGDASAPAPATPAPDPKFRKAMDAAFKTAQLVDRMIMVTKDDSMREYPGGGKHISFAYENIINGMQAPPPPPMSPEIQKAVDAARKVLYELDEDGDIAGKSSIYKRYSKNALAYAKAKKDFADAQRDALNDPTKADTWPQDSAYYQAQVDEAWDTWKTEGADKVEAALDTIESVGVSLQDRMIAKARKTFDAWNLGLAGVPVPVQYAYVTPTKWCDPEDDDDGWQTLEVTSKHYASHEEQHSHFFNNSSSHSDSSSTSGSGGVSFFGFGASGGGGTSSSHSDSHSDAGGGTETMFHNDATDLTISLQYGLCDIFRPGVMGDLFYMKNFYIVNNPKNSISNGTLDGQDDCLLPMLPMQFLVVRNLRISTKKWGQDAATLTKYFGNQDSDSSSSSSNISGGASFGFGPFSLNASASHSSSNADSHSSGSESSDARKDYEANFDGETLEIKGAQIMAWLSTIVPAGAPLDDPGLKKPATEEKQAEPAPAH